MSFSSFQVRAVGRVAKNPELQKKGDSSYVRIALIGNDYAGQGKDSIATTVFFVAFGAKADVLAQNVRKGDQLIIDAHIRNNNYQNGETTEYRNSYIVDAFTWGAPGPEKRAELARDSHTDSDGDDVRF